MPSVDPTKSQYLKNNIEINKITTYQVYKRVELSVLTSQMNGWALIQYNLRDLYNQKYQKPTTGFLHAVLHDNISVYIQLTRLFDR